MIMLVVKSSERVKNREAGIGLFFQASKSVTDSSSEKPATVEKKKKRNTLEDLIINENTLNAEIRWTLIPLIPIKMQFFLSLLVYLDHTSLSFRQIPYGAIYER